MKGTIRKAMYLSGPMTGYDDYNYPAFHAAAAALRGIGEAVVNPAESFGGDQRLSFDTYMRHDLKTILQDCDCIVVLPGWEDSPGAVLEVAVGVALGYGILSLKSTSPVVVESVFPLHDKHRDRLACLFGIGEWAPEAKPTTGPEPMTTWAEAEDGLLKAADHIVNGDRQRTYGHPMEHHEATAAMWSAYLGRVNHLPDLRVRPEDVSMLFVLDKVSRVGGGDKVDNVLDIAGYAQVHAKVRARQVGE